MQIKIEGVQHYGEPKKQELFEQHKRDACIWGFIMLIKKLKVVHEYHNTIACMQRLLGQPI